MNVGEKLCPNEYKIHNTSPLYHEGGLANKSKPQFAMKK